MGTRVTRIICIFVLGLMNAAAVLAQQLAPQPLITQPVDESQLTTLHGNTYPLAQPQFDIGAAPPNLPMQRMLLVLKRAPQQDFALRTLLDDQQDKASPNYHKWLTPDQFGTQFGPSDQDMQLVTGWLQANGFQVNRVSHGRTVIEFSGVEAQVEQAFHTQIHQYLVNGASYLANASDPQIPTALVPAVAGLLSLHNFPRKSMSKLLGTYSPATKRLTANPQFTLGFNCFPNGTCYAVGPADFGAIYNVQSLWTSGIDGTGQKIAIVGESDINIQDVRDFRTAFGLPAKDPNIIYDGPNPGLQPDESEADIDVQWSGAIAPKATINFVVSGSTETTSGVDLSAVYIIDNNLAPVMSESYGECELGIGTAGNQFYNLLWAQAAAQGITAILSSGDSGSALCDFQGAPAQLGLAVSGFASTPFNVAIGGTDFNDFLHETQYWNTSNTSPTLESAKGYIPETTWNLSCTNSLLLNGLGFVGTSAETNCNNVQLSPLLLTVGGSGGASNCTTSNSQSPASCAGGYAKPSWQVSPGVPADGKRDLPDVSLFASNGVLNSFYIFCESDAQANCSFSEYAAAGGTSFGAPAFAGIMALVNQQMQMPHGQGNPNYVLYKLAGQQTASACNSTTGPGANCVFNDVTSGTIAMPCVAGSRNCTVNTTGDAYGVLSGYSTGPGYDLATGLGTVNVTNLLNMWNTVVFRPTATTLTLSPTINITHGQAVTVNASVSPSTGSGIPSGNVSLLTSTGVGVDGFSLSGGALSGTTNLLPGGSYTVAAHYAGDSTFGGSDSTPVQVTVGKENSSSQIELITFDWQGRLISNNATTAVYGSPYVLRVDVFNSLGSACQPNPIGESGCPTGNVNLTDNSSPLNGGVFGLNSHGYSEDQVVQFPGGNNSVKAVYAGDNSFNGSSAANVYSIAEAPTTISAIANCCYDAGSTLQAQVTIQSQSLGPAPGGNVTFFANGIAIPGSVIYSSRPGSFSNPTASLTAFLTSSSSPFPTPGTYALSATYAGDGNYAPVTSPATSVSVKFPVPQMNLTPSSSVLQPGATLTLTAVVVGSSKTIAPTGTITFYADSFGPMTGNVSYSTFTDSTGNLDLKGVVSFVPVGTQDYSATYSGDQNYPNNGPVFAFNVAISGNDFTLSTNPLTVTVQPGVPGNTLLILGFQSNTQPIVLSSSLCSGLPAEAVCILGFNQVNSTSGVPITIRTGAPHFASSIASDGSRRWLMFGLGLPFTAILILGIPPRRKLNQVRLALAIGVALVGLGCGGGGGSTPPVPHDPGTPRGSYAITVTATSGTGSSGITHTTTFTLVVN